MVHDYTTLSGLIVRETCGNVVIDYAYNNNGRPFSITVNNNGTKHTGYYLLNLQGDVIAILDSSGTVAVEYDYTPYGAILHYSTSGTTGSIFYQYNALLYRGYYYDADLGMYYLQSRFYDPVVCRFINADEIIISYELMGYNLCAYCYNDPINHFDSNGYMAIESNWYLYGPATKSVGDPTEHSFTIQTGFQVSAACGASGTGGVSVAVDGQGKSAVVATGGVGAGTPYAGVALSTTITNAASVDKLSGVSYSTGFSLFFLSMDILCFCDENGNQYSGGTINMELIPIWVLIPVEYHVNVSTSSVSNWSPYEEYMK